jgi:hypothetical protein
MHEEWENRPGAFQVLGEKSAVAKGNIPDRRVKCASL